jgi:hypothetical protein
MQTIKPKRGRRWPLCPVSMNWGKLAFRTTTSTNTFHASPDVGGRRTDYAECCPEEAAPADGPRRDRSCHWRWRRGRSPTHTAVTAYRSTIRRHHPIPWPTASWLSFANHRRAVTRPPRMAPAMLLARPRAPPLCSGQPTQPRPGSPWMLPNTRECRRGRPGAEEAKRSPAVMRGREFDAEDWCWLRRPVFRRRNNG